MNCQDSNDISYQGFVQSGVVHPEVSSPSASQLGFRYRVEVMSCEASYRFQVSEVTFKYFERWYWKDHFLFVFRERLYKEPLVTPLEIKGHLLR